MVLVSNVITVVGRCLIAGLFLYSGQDKLRNFESNRKRMLSYGLPFALPGLIAAVVTELVGGLLLALGVLTPFVAIVLALYVTAVSLAIPVKDLADASKRVDTIHLLANNVAIVGGLLYVVGVQSR